MKKIIDNNIFSFGLILLKLAMLEDDTSQLYNGNKFNSDYLAILIRDFKNLEYSNEFVQLIINCLQIDSNIRLSFEELCKKAKQKITSVNILILLIRILK